jgi:hypothetical protein
MKTIEELARETAENLHEYFESVRSDPLRVPDSDTTEAMLLRFLSAVHAGPLKGVEEGLTGAITAIENVDRHVGLLGGESARLARAREALALLQSVKKP